MCECDLLSPKIRLCLTVHFEVLVRLLEQQCTYIESELVLQQGTLWQYIYIYLLS